MEPVKITSELIQGLHLPGADKQVLHRNRGHYVGAERTERGWLVLPGRLCIAQTEAQWHARYGSVAT